MSFATILLEVARNVAEMTSGARTAGEVALRSVLRASVWVTVVSVVSWLFVEPPRGFTLLSSNSIDCFNVFFIDSEGGVFGLVYRGYM